MAIQAKAVIVLLFVYVTAVHTKVVTRSRRATTLENVQAIYNRFTRTSKGKATYYGEYPGGGLCSLDPLPPLASQTEWIKVAVSKEDFQKSLGCGMCVVIYGSGNPSAPDLKGTTPVKGVLKGMVYDLCGSCKQGDVDLYVPGNGVWDITMKAIDCPSLKGSVGYIQFKFTQSNEWYFKLQARNSKIPVAGVEVFNTVTSDWYCLKRIDDNYFASQGLGKVTFPMKVRLTSITNEKVETTITTLKNDEAFPSDVQFSGLKIRGGSPEDIQCFGQGHKSTKDKGPEVDEKFCAGKADGTYADPVDCSAFYVCYKGKSNKQYCLDGLKFNALIGKCDDAENVNCPEKDSSTNKMFAKNSETIEIREMSPRSIKEGTDRSALPHKRKHRYHYHKRMRSHKHHRHGQWKNMNKKKEKHIHRRKLHLKATGTKIHQGFKRTPEKKLNVKLKVQIKGPNLSGTFETKDPMNPNEGRLTVSAVENAERGDDVFAVSKTKTTDNGHDDVSVSLQESNGPMSFSAGVPNGNPFKFGDDMQLIHSSVGRVSDEEKNRMAGSVVLQASQMGDGTVQTSTTVKPLLNSDANENAIDSDLNKNAMNIKTLLRNSFQTKPQAIYSKESDAKNKNNQTLNADISVPNVIKPKTNIKKNVTTNQGGVQLQTVQGIMETLNLMKAIKQNMSSSNIPGNIPVTNKSINTTTSGNNIKNTKGVMKVNKLDAQNGGSAVIQNGNKNIGNNQGINKTKKEEPKGASKPSKQDANFGILFIINKTKNQSKKQQQVNPVIGNGVTIIPDVDNKMKQITDKTTEKMENNTIVNQNTTFNGEKNEKKPKESNLKVSNSMAYSEGHQLPNEHQSSNVPKTTKGENSKQTKDVSSIHHIIHKTGPIVGLMGLIGDLVKANLKNKNSTNETETVDSNIAMTNGSEDKSNQNGNDIIGKVNISLQTVNQGELQENSYQEKENSDNSTAANKEQNASSDLSNQLQVLESPRLLQQVTQQRNKSEPSERIKKKQNTRDSELQVPIKMPVGGSQENTGSAQTKQVSVPVPVMRIRLKGSSKTLGAAPMFHDELFEGKHSGKFINALKDGNEESNHQEKPFHTTTVIIRQYNKDDKNTNYEPEDTLPMEGSEQFDAYGNRKMAPPTISLNEADNLLEVDKHLLEDAAIHNVLYNPTVSNSYPENKDDNMNMVQENGLSENEREAEDFAHALRNQDDEPKAPHKTAVKVTGADPQQVLSPIGGDRFGNVHRPRVNRIKKPCSIKPHKTVVSNYGSSPMGMGNENNRNYLDMEGMGNMPMGGSMQDMDEMDGMQGMTGMGGGMQGMKGMGGRMQGMVGMGGMQGMRGMGGRMQGMVGMGGMQGMRGMGGRMQGMNGMSAGTQSVGGMGGGMKGPMGMQVMGGSQEEINNNMKQALSNMKDMAMKQIQSKYPGMPITMKADDGGEESGDEPTTSLQQESGNNQGETGSTSSEESTSSQQATSEVFGKHQNSKSNNEQSKNSESKGNKLVDQNGKEEQVGETNNQKINDHKTVLNDQKPDNQKSGKESQKSDEHVKNDDKGRQTVHETSKQKPLEKHADQAKDSLDNRQTNEDTNTKIEPKQVCKERASGVYTNKEDPSKFIICYNGITEERQCADGMVFNPREKVCETHEKLKDNKSRDKSKVKSENKKTKTKNSKNVKGTKTA